MMGDAHHAATLRAALSAPPPLKLEGARAACAVQPPWTQTPGEVDRRDAAELDAGAFLCTYALPNRPVLVTGLTASWRAAADWVDASGAADVAALAARFPDASAPVADCAAREDAPRPEMTLRDYAAYWTAHAVGTDTRLLYLKDWHCAAQQPEYVAYAPPPLFGDDALNAYFDARRARSTSSSCADYRFVYCGPAGSGTPLHADVLHSASWSANVAGVKAWLLFPPQHTAGLRTARGALPPDAEAVALSSDVAASALRVTQHAGETLFVPPGWHHQVRNVTHALSINHNWIHPAAGLHWALGFVHEDAIAAAAAIQDLAPPVLPAEEFAALVQRNTAANAGLDFAQLASMAWRTAQAPLAALRQQQQAAGEDHPSWRELADALTVQRCGCVLRALAAEPAHCFVHHAEDGDAAVAPGAWADELAQALTAKGFPPC